MKSPSGLIGRRHVFDAQASPTGQLVHRLSSGDVNRPNRDPDKMSGPADGYDCFSTEVVMRVAHLIRVVIGRA
jgi:hypothetical protein